MAVPGFLDNSLDRRRFRADNGDDAVGGYDIPESDVDKFDGHLGPPRLCRFPGPYKGLHAGRQKSWK
ncbi:hypothetical protein D3C72_2466580 [compost metagenome]